MCPGKEVGTVEIATFLHYFVTRYRSVSLTKSLEAKKNPPEQFTDNILAPILSCRWEEEGNNTISKFPRVAAPNGLHIRVQDY